LRMAFRAVLLAGGRGSRLESALPGLPKALVPIGGVPLLTLQLSRLRLEGCLQAVVVGGHGIHLVRNALATFSSSLQGVLVEERSGTLPAVLAGLATAEPSPEPIVVLNADTILEVDIASFAEASPAWATVTAVLTELPTGQNQGTVLLAPTGRILAFEGTDSPAGNEATPFRSFESWSRREECRSLSNCGAYVVDRTRLLLYGPMLKALGSSWECHALVHYRRHGLLAGVAPPVRYVLDVGTPPRYRRACADASLIHEICGYAQDACEPDSRLV
jgi:NDP-sugar pyrophosphorylase family protein